MSPEPLDELYFEWLYAQVASTRLKNPTRTYWSLLRQLYTTEFKWYLPNDDNRVYEGKELRLEFLERNPSPADSVWLEEGASFLEMLIALSRRLSFAHEKASSSSWFWTLMENVNLHVATDDEYARQPQASQIVNDILQRLNDRTYDYNGRGGLFPLNHTDIDQRHVELWYQMQYYLIERS